MLNKNLAAVFTVMLLFTFVSFLNAQEKLTEKKENKMTMQHDMQKCMDKIAADSTLRMQMMDKMMDKCNNDKECRMQMCRTMMDNPEMHKTMMKMMDEKGMMKHKMMDDSSGTMKEKRMKHNMMDDSSKTMKK